MKYMRLASILIAILAVLIISLPVSAASGYLYNVNGIELNAGTASSHNSQPATLGAAFSALATSSSNTGLLHTSVNYYGLGPDAIKGNIIFGGTWSITSLKGIITGKIVQSLPGTGDSRINWSGPPSNPTAVGAATIYLTIDKGTLKFAGIKGTGVFNGEDIHASGVYITINGQRIEVPVLKGHLSLTY
jgi:hypothetical protein